MKRQILRMTAGALALTALLCCHAHAAQTTTVTPGTTNRVTQAQSKARPIPYYGKVAAVDAAKGTFTVGKRTFQTTAETRIQLRNKAPATLAAATVGMDVSGSYRKAEDGRLLVNTLYIGPKTEATAAGTTPPPTAPKPKSK